MREIPLGARRGGPFVAKVSDEDYNDLVAMGRWMVRRTDDKRYVYAVVKTGCRLENTHPIYGYMHRLLLSAEKGQSVDHKNFDTLDNRRENIRLCTVRQNNAHSRKRDCYAGKPTSSKYKGVAPSPNGRGWYVRYNWQGKTRQLPKPFFVEKAAAVAYKMIAQEIHGDFAHT